MAFGLGATPFQSAAGRQERGLSCLDSLRNEGPYSCSNADFNVLFWWCFFFVCVGGRAKLIPLNSVCLGVRNFQNNELYSTK